MNQECDIRERLTAYLSEMNKWELRCEVLDADVEAGKIHPDDLGKIIGDDYVFRISTRFLSASAQKRRQVFSTPPEFDPENELIEKIELNNENEALVHTKEREHFKQSFVYAVVFERGDWFLAKRMLIGHDGVPIESSL